MSGAEEKSQLFYRLQKNWSDALANAFNVSTKLANPSVFAFIRSILPL
jgi:hypothetical protein